MASKTSGKPRMQISVMATPKLQRVLKHLALAYEAAEDKEALAVPYIITCAAALEARLNDALTSHATTVWRDAAGPIRQALLSLSFRGKLETAVVLLTGERYRLNPEDEYVRRLHSLISYRNLLVHPKPAEHEVDSVVIAHPIYGANFPVPGDEYLRLVNDLTFGAKNVYSPSQYHDALDKLERWFFSRLPDRVSKIRLLKPRGEA